MESIGLDLHKNHSQICVIAESGEMTERRIRTRPGTLSEFFRRPRARVLLEASTESEWVASLLAEMNHDVVVGDPNYEPMYAFRSRSVKTDKRDAEALALACRRGLYRRAHRLSEQSRQLRVPLRVRQQFVQMRTGCINQIRACVRAQGLRLPPGKPDKMRERLGQIALAKWIVRELDPMLEVLDHLNEKIRQADAWLKDLARTDDTIRRLTTVPGIGPVTATSFVADLDDPHRFTSARGVRSYLGLVPRESSSGERRRLGRITKAGSPRTRSLLVEAAWSIHRRRCPLREWAARIARRRGRNKAAVALARKIAGILWAIWRDGSVYRPELITFGQEEVSPAA
jgi:transposase